LISKNRKNRKKSIAVFAYDNEIYLCKQEFERSCEEKIITKHLCFVIIFKLKLFLDVVISILPRAKE